MRMVFPEQKHIWERLVAAAAVEIPVHAPLHDLQMGMIFDSRAPGEPGGF